MIILVTGAAGFIGSRLCRALANADARVIGLDDYSMGSRDNQVAGVDYREGSTRDVAELVPEDPAIIFHLGEYSRVESSFADQDEVTRSNVIGSAGVFDYWTGKRCKLVYAGSSTRFATDGSSSPYSRSKKANADLVLSLAEHEGLPAAVTYFYNVYGPGERTGATGTLIETFRQQWLNGDPLTVVSPGTQRRNFTHVDDIVDGLLLVAILGVGEFPIGAAWDYSPLEVAGMFGGGSITMLPQRAGNRKDAAIDTSRIRELGWLQKRNLRDYIASVKAERLACAS